MRTAGSNREETGRRVQQAALRLFAERGFAATGIRDLAQAAGVTSGALYHYMGTKADLLVEIMRSTIVPLLDVGHDILAGEEPPEVQLAAMVEAHVWLHGSRPLATTVTDTEVRALTGERREEMMALRDAYDDVWRKIVKAGMTTGRFDVVDERVATLAVLDLCTGVSKWYTPSGRLRLGDLCIIHTDLVFGTLRARRGRRPLRRADIRLPSPVERFALEDVEELGTAET
jgi:AcrR family transcriptional regulator